MFKPIKISKSDKIYLKVLEECTNTISGWLEVVFKIWWIINIAARTL